MSKVDKAACSALGQAARALILPHEAVVVKALTMQPKTTEAISVRCRLTQAEARRTLQELAEKKLATFHDGVGYSLPTKAKQSGHRHRVGDVVSDSYAVLLGDAEERLSGLPDECVDAVVTSPPYYKRIDYGVSGQIGWERTPDLFVAKLLNVFTQVSRVLRPHGLVFVVMQDTTDNCVLARTDHKLMARIDKAGLVLFREASWRKNAFPNGSDNALARNCEKVFLLTKSKGHYWDTFSAKEPGKNGIWRRLQDVWDIPTERGEHKAAFPRELVRRCLTLSTSAKGYCKECGAPWERQFSRGESSCKRNGHRRRLSKVSRDHVWNGVLDHSETKVMSDMQHIGWSPSCGHGKKIVRGVVLDPFSGSGTTGAVCMELDLDYIGIDIAPENVSLSVATIRDAIEKRSEP